MELALCLKYDIYNNNSSIDLFENIQLKYLPT